MGELKISGQHAHQGQGDPPRGCHGGPFARRDAGQEPAGDFPDGGFRGSAISISTPDVGQADRDQDRQQTAQGQTVRRPDDAAPGRGSDAGAHARPGLERGAGAGPRADRRAERACPGWNPEPESRGRDPVRLGQPVQPAAGPRRPWWCRPPAPRSGHQPRRRKAGRPARLPSALASLPARSPACPG